ncbi:PIG-L family deacetylase [Sphingobacterium phlebotomi]|uniref:PIG-L family deacetylase n=1 Tax=Sphingobacterium phlebotomi TaxID=2605433 RepID=A0A5D4H9G5_9SPHI|nr:PIG-L family deacetylase [Sphingobacterium phlebotomi]TYR37268.1 PIG-L family deacetylase [Sphingobacterium phlebotomi]
MRQHIICIFFAFFFAVHFSLAQSAFSSSSSAIQLQMERLNVLGSALYFAAHPDDENTKLISYLAAERKVRTAYLSLTRGDGGQNLIGTEQGIELGLIRTQELLQARKVDGGEQYFSSAFDFGFSKTYDETFSFWQKQEVLREAVWLIRKLQPDVIITRFPPDERGGHGHHQASAILAHEAFIAAADPKMFPEQLNEVKPWQAKRLLWNTASFMRLQGDDSNRLRIDIGQYNPLLGKSYGELSAISRSQHKSQGFGSASTNGISLETFENVAGTKATEDLFDDIDLSWNRLPHSEPIQLGIQKLLSSFIANKPQRSIPQLAAIWHEIQKLEDGYWKERKSKEVETIMLACAGIKVESLTPRLRLVEQQPINFQTEIVVRNPDVHVELLGINENKIGQTLPTNEVTTFEQVLLPTAITQPYWLRKPHTQGKFSVDPQNFGYPMNPDLPTAHIHFNLAGVPIHIQTPIRYRYVDPVRGEVHEYVEIAPAVTATFDINNLLVQQGERKTLQVTFQKHVETNKDIQVAINLSSTGWKIAPEKLTLSFPNGQDILSKTMEITNVDAGQKEAILSLAVNGKKMKDIREITYNHIPRQTWFPDAEAKLRPIKLVNPVKRVGYIMGAGDLVPEALRNIGTAVDILDVTKISSNVLQQYDAIVFGVRALNIHARITQKLPLIYHYIQEGGVVLMQYNVNSRLQEEHFSPKPAPFTITRARVTEEDAKVTFTDPKDPVLNYPNNITAEDFDGWVQERGLYFAENIDSHYRTPLAMGDKNEPQHHGSLLIYRMGKGKFVYTSLSFFRQLPAGVAGANRLFVNLLAKEK